MRNRLTEEEIMKATGCAGVSNGQLYDSGLRTASF